MGNQVICSICGHKLLTEPVKRCPKCGAVYPQSSREQFDFYEKLYDDRSTCISYLKRARIYETIANKILRVSKDKGGMALLDIGASVGMSIVLLEHYGKAIGTELDIIQLRRWHKFLGIESAMIYMNKDDDVNNFYTRLATELKGKIDFIFLIDTLRSIPSPNLIDIVSRCLRGNGAIVIKEVNPDNKQVCKERISGKHGDFIMYSPKTIRYVAEKVELSLDWYVVSPKIDNFAIKLHYGILSMLRFPSYVAILKRRT